VRVPNDVDQSNTIQADHLFEVDIPVGIPIDIVCRHAKVCSIRVGFEDIAPPGIRRL
jgi:hypothetical protein